MRILFLELPCQRDKQGHFFLHRLAKEWEKLGHSVSIHYGVEKCPPAEVLFLHVDQSIVPEKYLNVVQRYPVVVNRQICDIRKTTYSTNRVLPGDGYQGPVIIKSVNNSAGIPERNALFGESLLLRWGVKGCWRLAHFALRRLPQRRPYILYKSDYRIVPHREEVPSEWFSLDNIIIERFRPEPYEGKYVLREWYFFGDASWHECEVSSEPIFTTGQSADHLAQPPPPEIRLVRERFGMDYGKIDYAIDASGNPVLYDINKTIGICSPEDPKLNAMAQALALGLVPFAHSAQRLRQS
jgi:hypothetical protein